MTPSRCGAALALALPWFSVACHVGGEQHEPGLAPAVAQAPIVGGEVDEGHPAVVALTFNGQAFCSGTLVTPTLVVTAAHCLQDDAGNVFEGFEVFFGTRTNGSGEFVSVLQAVPKPDWYLDDPNIDDDIGVVRLAEPGPATPIPLGELPADGTTLTLVGFGTTSEEGGGAGTKRVTTSTIIDRETKIVYLASDPGAICSGDSGGTALARIDGVETLVGVHTRGDCDEISIEERVDAHTEFLAPFLAGASCELDGQCSNQCDEPDPDCPCANDGLCTAACLDASDDPDCPPSCGGPGNGCGRDCPAVDPDCPLCVADGRCELGCEQTPDPDCVQTTVGVASSGAGGGEDGAGGSGQGGGDAGAVDDEGCSVARPGAPHRAGASTTLLLIGGLGLIGAWRAGRRSHPTARRR